MFDVKTMSGEETTLTEDSVNRLTRNLRRKNDARDLWA